MLRPLGNINKMDPAELNILKKRIDIVSAVVIFFVVILVVRLWHLQIQQGAEYSRLSEVNRIRTQYLAAPRGNILDRNGEIIISNRPRFNVVWIREDAPHPDEVIKQLAGLLGMDISELLDRIRAGADHPRYMPTRLKEDVDWKTLVQIENNSFNLPGVQIEVLPSRDYLYGNMASHLIGYLGEINRQELDERSAEGYLAGDQIGKMGVEKLFEPYLKGEKGYSLVEVDVHGFAQKQLQIHEPLPGGDLRLTLDIKIQKAAEDAMADKAGAVVAMEVNTGRLLALVSAPALPLNKFEGGIPTPVWRGLLEDPKTPLINKPIQGQYPPGSTYKLITALAGLEEKVITPETVHYCPGFINFGNRRYGCWKKGGHGAVNLNKAISESCDVYFYQVGQKLGVDTLARYAALFGLGRKTGIKLEHEKEGLVPTSEWKQRRHQEPWQEGETMSVAIGQGFNLATPLQINRMTAAVANGGKLYRPLLVDSVRDQEGNMVTSFPPVLENTAIAKENSWRLVRQGMIDAVNGEHATARAAKFSEIVVAGKTGTAQVVRLAHFEHLKGDAIPYKFRDHAWFTCYAPADNPEIAVTVLVEHGGGGGSVAAPIAKAVLKSYFAGRLGAAAAPEPPPPPATIDSEE